MYPPLDELYVGAPIVPAKVNTLLPTVSVQVEPLPGYDEVFPASKYNIDPLTIVGVGDDDGVNDGVIEILGVTVGVNDGVIDGVNDGVLEMLGVIEIEGVSVIDGVILIEGVILGVTVGVNDGVIDGVEEGVILGLGKFPTNTNSTLSVGFSLKTTKPLLIGGFVSPGLLEIADCFLVTGVNLAKIYIYI